MRDVPRSWWICGWLCVVLLALLPVVRRWTAEAAGQERCSFDGLRIDRRHRVRMASGDDRQSWRSFCSLSCAEGWTRASGSRPSEIRVTDESSGDEIDLSEATIVHSGVIVHAGTGDRRHVFRDPAAAASHAALYHGRILAGDRRPFAAHLPSTQAHRNPTPAARQ